MSSSDSEEDCYSNVAKKLNKMKEQFKDAENDSVAVINEDADISIEETMSESVNNTNKNQLKTLFPLKSIDDFVEKKSDTIAEIEPVFPSTNVRMTRSKAKNLSISIEQAGNAESISPKSKRKSSVAVRKSTNVQKKSSQSTRGRQKRGRSRHQNTIFSHLPIYSIGDCSNVVDNSENQVLFSSVANEIITLDDELDDSLTENEELSVKVYWQNCEVVKFRIRKFQKITQIFEHFSKKENIGFDKLLFTYNDQILKRDDTPSSINYKISKFIDGGVVKNSITHDAKVDLINTDPNIVRIKFQFQNVKPFETNVKLDEKLSISMVKCAEHLECTLDKLKFYFDGDNLIGSATPRQLELEGGETIDVKMIT